jgi:antitoxin component of RelBE/YafQ-DinJ toxin-antitoxin module
MHFFLPNYQRLSVAARKKIWMALRKKMGMTVRKFIRMLRRKMAESKIIRMPTVTKRMKCTVIVAHLCWTQ